MYVAHATFHFLCVALRVHFPSFPAMAKSMRRWKPIWIPYGDNVQKCYLRPSQTRKVWLVDVATDRNASVTLLRFSSLYSFCSACVSCYFFPVFFTTTKNESKKKYEKNKKTKTNRTFQKMRPPRRGISPPHRDGLKKKILFFLAKMVSEIVQQLRPTNTCQKKTNKK